MRWIVIESNTRPLMLFSDVPSSWNLCDKQHRIADRDGDRRKQAAHKRQHPRTDHQDTTDDEGLALKDARTLQESNRR